MDSHPYINKKIKEIICEILTAGSMKMTAFWDIAPYSLTEVEVCTASIIRAMNWSTSMRLHGTIAQKGHLQRDVNETYYKRSYSELDSRKQCCKIKK
jgi:hypothetical protein